MVRLGKIDEEKSMRASWISLPVAALIMATLVGCGSTSDRVTEETQPAVSVTQTQVTDTSVSQSQTTETSVPPAPTGGAWATVATLRSTDSPWQDMDDVLVSEPFRATGDIQIVLDMPDAGELDGVIIGIVPADAAADAFALLEAVIDGTVVTLVGVAPSQQVPGLDGTYVLVNSVPASKAWSVEVQARP